MALRAFWKLSKGRGPNTVSKFRLPKHLRSSVKRPSKGSGKSLSEAAKQRRQAIRNRLNVNAKRRVQDGFDDTKGGAKTKAVLGAAAVGGAYIGGRWYQQKKDREAFKNGNFMRRYKVNSSRWRPGGNV